MYCIAYLCAFTKSLPSLSLRAGDAKMQPFGSWTRGTYIFNLLNFTYCLNDSCIFNESR